MLTFFFSLTDCITLDSLFLRLSNLDYQILAKQNFLNYFFALLWLTMNIVYNKCFELLLWHKTIRKCCAFTYIPFKTYRERINGQLFRKYINHTNTFWSYFEELELFYHSRLKICCQNVVVKRHSWNLVKAFKRWNKIFNIFWSSVVKLLQNFKQNWVIILFVYKKFK